MESSSRNPFADYNANVMDSGKILDFWCSPFFKNAPISEENVCRDAMPIVFLGGRGTGKTMFLKYFSYQVQRDVARRRNDASAETVISHLKSRGGIGFYLRFDGPLLRSFKSKGIEDEIWDAIFVQYFELQACKAYIEVIADLDRERQLDHEDVTVKFVPEIARLVGAPGLVTVTDLLGCVEDRVAEVTAFRADVAFSAVKFHPTKAFSSQDLTFEVPMIARQTIRDLGDMNFVILLDEYENFDERQQVVVNTLLKFVKKGTTFRVGMRQEGFHTFGTTSPREFIKEGRDYTKYVFEDILVRGDEEYRSFLISVARKRLQSVSAFAQADCLDICKILGEDEDLEAEATSVVSKSESPKHFDLLKAPGGQTTTSRIAKIIAAPDRPLLEMMNIVWLLRGRSPEQTKLAMEEYLQGAKTELARKYRNDFVNKYKLSLTLLLNSLYRQHKMYYSFRTFSLLSSGIVGNFIELCRRSFQYAMFQERDDLLRKGCISIELQDKAARDLANDELQMTRRIQDYGAYLHSLAVNLGNIFSEYHRDPSMRYPETNQFTVSHMESDETGKIFAAAMEWSIVQRKPALQRREAGEGKTDIYTLNRVFAPAFDLTYRTRGGYSIEIDGVSLRRLMSEDSPKLGLGPRARSRPNRSIQSRLAL